MRICVTQISACRERHAQGRTGEHRNGAVHWRTQGWEENEESVSGLQ